VERAERNGAGNVVRLKNKDGTDMSISPRVSKVTFGAGWRFFAALLMTLGAQSALAQAQNFPTVINTVAGSSGDNQPATSSPIASPSQAVLDSNGNLFIADTLHNRIRKVDTNGTITTVAGNGTAGFSGDNGAATSASLQFPQGVFADATGNLFIADEANNRIRKVNASGVITTVAGGSTSGFAGDGGPATSAQLRFPFGVFVDSAGNLFIADEGNSRIRKVDTAGTITTIAGNGTVNFSGDNGPATSASLQFPIGVFADATGNLFIADQGNNRVRKVNASGVITTVAGTGAGTFSGDNNPATGAQLNVPASVFVDSAGNLFIADQQNAAIRRVDHATQVITTVAGNGTGGFVGDGGPATSAQLNFPSGVFVDSAGNLFIADEFNNRVRKVDITGNITTVAGNGTGGFAGDNGPATSAQLSSPNGVFVDSAGSLFIADSSNNRIRKVDANGIITTVAGNGTRGFAGDGGPATSAQLSSPSGVFVDSAGNLFIADSSNNRIRKVDTNGTITTVAGKGTAGFSGDNGPATSGQLSFPFGAFVDSAGNLFIADSSNNRIRKVDTNGTITTVAGSGTAGFSGDAGSATGANLNRPGGIIADGFGNLFIADSSNNRIREVVTFPVANAQSSRTTPNMAAGLTLTGTSPRGSVPLTFVIASSPAQGTLSNFSASTGAVTYTPGSGFTGADSFTFTVNDGNATSSAATVNLTVVPPVALSPTSLTFTNQGVGTTSASQTVTLTNSGNAALSITSITVTGTNASDFVLAPANNCGTSVAAGANCTVSVSFKPGASGPRSASLTITDDAGNSPQSAAISGTGTDFSFTVSQGTATVTAGQMASFSFQLNDTGAQQTISLSCTGAPQGANCTVPATVSVMPGTAATVNVSVSTTGRAFLVPVAPRYTRPPAIWLALLSLLALLLFASRARNVLTRQAGVQPWPQLQPKLAALLPLALLLLSGALLSGCGGGGASKATPPPPTGTPAGTSTITVTATSNGVSHSTQLTLTVQ
jgi:sugar lactone lactonase YvrE